MARAGASPGNDPARFAGTYRYVGGEGEIRELDAAIESVVKQMNFLIRGIARSRLREPNLPSPAITIAVARGAITVARPSRPTVTAPASGEPIEWKSPSGDRFTVRHGVTADGLLYQRFEDDRSVTVNHFHLGDDSRLVIETTIHSRRLPSALVFRTTYQRAESK
jgi:hypothetical protein